MGCIWGKENSHVKLNVDDLKTVYTNLPSSDKRMVGFITNQPFDILHCNEKARRENQDDHEGVYHPECHDRVDHLWKYLEQKGLLQQGQVLTPRPATIQELDLVHTREYQADIRDERVKEDWEKSVYMSPGSYNAALTAAGSVLELVQQVWDKKLQRGFAVVRPPGHHAEVSRAQGFCLFNNVAIASSWLISVGKARRVAIVDWDAHAGNGQQEIFYNNPNVLTLSIHRYDNSTYYPGSVNGNYDRIGENKGKGTNVNIAWNTGGDYFPGDNEYKYAFEKLVLPILKQFKPDFILVAAGFDAALNDPLGGMRVSPKGYEWMTQQLCALGLPLVLTLEGGYNLKNLETCGSACARALLGSRDVSTFPFPHFNSIIDVGLTLVYLKPFYNLY